MTPTDSSDRCDHNSSCSERCARCADAVLAGPREVERFRLEDRVRELEAAQPPPKPSVHPAVWPLVIADMQGRDAAGTRKYGTQLRPHNGRDYLVDAYQEALDLAVYLRGAIYERDGR